MRPPSKRTGLVLLVSSGLAILAVGCGAAQARPAAVGNSSSGPARRVLSLTQASQEVYRLRAGDETEIILWGQTETAYKTPIRDDGTALFPPLGKIKMAGYSIQELEEEIRRLLNQQPSSETPGSPPAEPKEERPVLSSAEAATELYQLQPGDQMEISVWGQADLSKTVLVQDDGHFAYPLIGEVQAVGRSVSEVEKEIRERLDQDYIVNPQVTVRMVGAQFSVLGEKGDSGSYPIEGVADLLTALSKAGDISTLRSSRIEIIRRQGDHQVVIRPNLDRILMGEEPHLPILPHDAIYVKTALSDEKQVTIRMVGAKFTALGEVERPGAQSIEGPMDLLTAVSLSGGITKFGSSRVEIIRLMGEEKMVIRANLDRVLQGKDPNIPIFPRDTLYVRRRLL